MSYIQNLAADAGVFFCSHLSHRLKFSNTAFKFIITISLCSLFLQRRQEWEVRHGSLLGIKYLVAVRQVIANQDLMN